VHVFASIIPPFAAYAFGGLVALTAGQTLVIIGILVLEIIQGVIAGHVSKEFMQEIAMGVFGHVYIDLLLGHAVLVHELVCDSGTSVLAWVITCTLVGDNGGYLFGKIAGRRKFVQAISPNKSLEGFIGALGLSAFSSRMFFLLFQRMGHPLLLNSNFANEFEFICIGIGIGFVGLFGDLFESLLKRAYAIKDIGSIFPGWGGFLDRVDALIFVFPAIYYYLVITRGYSLTFPGCSTSSFYL
jgi:phosphatidate cytidylyltransferase